MRADWDDLRVFLTLASEGRLSAAARRLEVSHPTIARRIKSLEDAIGARLFDRLPDRFVLTSAGEELLADAQAMERAAESIERRSVGLGDTAQGTVRISAGEAMTAFLAAHLPRLRSNLQCVEFELTASHTLANLSRREADLLIREEVPELASIVTRRLARVAYAVYAGATLSVAGTSPEVLRKMPWLGFDDDHSYMPGQAWTLDLLAGARPQVRVNNWLVLHEAVRAGTGLAVLPCYLGEPDTALRRVGPILAEVSADQWLLVHRDLRALPRVRAVMDALVQLFQEERATLEGRRTGQRATSEVSAQAMPPKPGSWKTLSAPRGGEVR
jgi:DNA-binding transcriptional LysR family regulator